MKDKAEMLYFDVKDDIIEEEEWRDIKGFEGKYQVSNLGRVKSLPRKGTKGGIMTQHQRKCSNSNDRGLLYFRVALNICRGKTKWCSVNRLVAEAFIENPRGLEMVDHINNDPRDNRVENLQWISREDNVKKEWGKKIKCVETGETFNSITEAYAKLGKSSHSSSISTALKDENRTAYGYHWQEIKEGS